MHRYSFLSLKDFYMVTSFTLDQNSRRHFISTIMKSVTFSLAVAGPASLFANSWHPHQKSYTVGEVMDLFIKEVPGSPFDKTVDTLKSGNRNQVVTGIVTTMFATVELIRKAIDLKANFIIAHEPTFYNHQDDTKWLENDEVYRYKAELLEKNKIAVWRCHDYIHAHQPDGVRTGLVRALAWDQYTDSGNPRLLTLPGMSLRDII